MSYLYAPAFNRGLTRRQTKDVYAGKNIVRGFGMTALLLQFIPFVSPFLLPALVLGGAELFHHEFKEEV